MNTFLIIRVALFFICCSSSVLSEEPGKIGPGLARLVSSLEPNDATAIRFQKMLNEIQDTQPNEKMVSAINLGENDIARFITYPKEAKTYVNGQSPYKEDKNIAVFQYNPAKLRIIDFLEEEQHWEQIKKGLHLRDWAGHPLVQRFPEHGRILILEDLAKRAVLQQNYKKMSWDLRNELKRELTLVWEGTYGLVKGAHLTPAVTKISHPPTKCSSRLKSLK